MCLPGVAIPFILLYKTKQKQEENKQKMWITIILTFSSEKPCQYLERKKKDPKELQFSGLVQKYHRKENANNKNV